MYTYVYTRYLCVGALLDYVELTTNRNRSIKAGNPNGGDLQETLKLPKGSTLFGFYGGYGGHLHHIGIYYSPSQATESSTDVKQSLKDIFKQLVAEGMNPNEAAAAAIKRLGSISG